MTAPQPPILLKTPSPSPHLDTYTTHLSPPFPPPHYIPVLTHTLLPDALIKLLLAHLDQPIKPPLDQPVNPPPNPSTPPPSPPFQYGALILTSQRAVAALSSALSAPPLQQKEGYRERLRELRIRLYTVGPATAKAVVEVRDRHLPKCPVLGGEKAGSGEVLGRLMLDQKNEEGCYYDVKAEAEADEEENKGEGVVGGKLKPVLFLTGEKRRDIIPRMLQSTGLEEERRVRVDEMVVYKTGEREDFGFLFRRVLGQTEGEGGRWVVVFSPTGGREVFRGLGWWDEGRGRVRERVGWEQGRRTWVCCIGPTTGEYLEREFGFVADVVAERPSAEGVREGIERFMRERERGKEEML